MGRLGQGITAIRSRLHRQRGLNGTDYIKLLSAVAGHVPRAVKGLQEAATTRLKTLQAIGNGARLAGVNDLLLYLDETADLYSANAQLAKIAFLPRRLAADFETALEATLSGYTGVAADAMRDVLEVEYLLLAFVDDPADMDVWLEGTDAARFRPAPLRKRLREAGFGEFTGSVLEGADYAAHSAALHVSPQEPIIGHKGRASDPLERDAGFWEMFQHARRIVLALEACGLAVTGEEWKASERNVDLARVSDAHSRTQQMQTMYLALLTGPPRLREQLGREPRTAEILAYVRDQLLAEVGEQGSDDEQNEEPQSDGE